MAAIRPLTAFLVASMLCIAGCRERLIESPKRTPSQPPPKYDPETFRTEVERLIVAGRYDVAVAYLESADARRQAEFDETGYLAIASMSILLPGAAVHFDRDRDWCIPGTSDVIEDMDWQKAATKFAEAYNRHRVGG